MNLISQEDFILKIKLKHKNENYNYDKIIYKGNRYNIIISCKKHGDFEVVASSFLNGQKCTKCELDDRKNECINKAKKIHNNKYLYHNVDYKTSKIPVKITCPAHGDFYQSFNSHLKGYGCSKCSKKNKPITEEWINIVKNKFNYNFDYSKVNYITNKIPVCIICPIHGEFYSTPNNFIKSIYGCPKCNSIIKQKESKKTTKKFIEEAKKIHGEKYDYNNVDYINKRIKVKIICPIHGEFLQSPSVHLNGCGCQKCMYKNQNLLFEKLLKSFPDEKIETEYSTQWLLRQRFDIYFLNHNIAVEYNGIQHYEPVDKFGGIINFHNTIKRDKLKTKKCKENNCNIFFVKYNYNENDYNSLIYNIKDIIDTRNNQKEDFVEIKQ